MSINYILKPKTFSYHYCRCC